MEQYWADVNVVAYEESLERIKFKSWPFHPFALLVSPFIGLSVICGTHTSFVPSNQSQLSGLENVQLPVPQINKNRTAEKLGAEQCRAACA